MPSTVAISVAAGAISIVLRAPAITRESTSRPSWSVPKGYVLLGLCRTSSNWNVGSCGAMWYPKIAQIVQKVITRTAITNVGERSSSAIVSWRELLTFAGAGRAVGGIVVALTPSSRSGCED